MTGLLLAAVGVALLAGPGRWLREAVRLGHRLSRPRIQGSDFAAETLGPFYFPNSVDPGDFAELDERGVRVVDFAKKPTTGKTGRQYVFTLVAQYGLGSWDLWQKDRDPARLEAARTQADWLVENQTIRPDGVGVWEHRYDLGGEHRVKAPWVSAISQGLSISLLMRTWQETGHAPHRDAAERALRCFAVPVEAGGVRTADASGGAFYEEVPSDSPRHILNGHVYALLGIHDYFRATGSEEAAAFFRAGVDALRANLSRYDAGRWSLYSLGERRTLANHFGLPSPLYHRLHIDMMRVLHAITGDPRFGECADRWQGYLGGPFDLAIRFGYAAFRDLVLAAKRVGLRP